MGFPENQTRRQFLWAGTAAAGGLLAAGVVRADEPAENRAANTAEDVSPAEDLMREHGVLRRLLLVYEEVDRRIAEAKPSSRSCSAMPPTSSAISSKTITNARKRTTSSRGW